MTVQELDQLVVNYNTPDFIEHDPISIPHQFSRKQDIEIAALIAATFAWGTRKTIINKSNDFLHRMDWAPYQFITSFEPTDLRAFQSFKHRTFNGEDAISLLYFLQHHYNGHDSLEDFFLGSQKDVVFHGLNKLNKQFRTLPSTANRSYKHVSNPGKNSACKRLNMFLRWMVRQDNCGVDFGIWKNISPSELIIPLDVHVLRSAKKIGLLNVEKATWKTALILTNKLREFDREDPVKYDFALFNLSLERKSSPFDDK